MTLLREIQNAAAATESRVADLLRKSKILAVRLKSDELGRWVDQELNGYTNVDDLPAYRGPIEVQSLGDFSGPFQSGLQNAPIPPISLPDRFLTHFRLDV